MSFTLAKGFTAKKPLDNPSEQMTKVMEWVSQDAGPMVPVKNKDGLDLLNGVKKDIASKAVANPLLKLGLDSGNLVLRVEGAPKYEKTVVLVKGYEALKKERAKTTVVNAHVGNAAIDEASEDMAKAKGTRPESSDDVDLNAKGSQAPIIILAHGTPTGTLPGTVYAKAFARKTPDEIVSFLVNDKACQELCGGRLSGRLLYGCRPQGG